MEGEKCLWTLAKPKTTMIKIKDPSVLITTSMDTWLKNAERRKRMTQESVSNVGKLGILQRIAKRNS